MKLTFIGATHEVTGSCTMIEVGGKYGLVDCGMEQGEDIFENQEIPVNPARLDFVLLTHAHIDHSGNIPLLFKEGFKGPIYATSATCNLCNIMLRDSAHIQESEAEYKSRKSIRAGGGPVEPIYSIADAETAIKHLRPCDYDEVIQISDGVEIRFTDVGHLLGSASIEIWLTEKDETRKIVFSGDIGNQNQPIINNPKYISEADYVITESTYGDRYHEKDGSDVLEHFANCIQLTLDRGGNVVVPSFAVGRTQELLFLIREIKVNGLVTGHGDFPVYVDSPLANEATGIFLQCGREYFDEAVLELLDKGINPLMSPGVITSVTSEESKLINSDNTPKVILSASGMCEAGRIRHHLKYNLWKEENLILFVGYQASGTTGRALLDGAKKIKLFGEEIAVKAEIAQLQGKSGHADKAGLLKWINSFEKKPQMVFINHGDDISVKNYGNCLIDEYDFEASAPYSGATFDLLKNKYIDLPNGILIEKKKAKEARAADVYSRLVAAGERLQNSIRMSKGLPNKEIAKFTSRINDMADKLMDWKK